MIIMANLYRKAKGIKNLNYYGIFIRRTKRVGRAGILVTHPNQAMATKEESVNFPHYEIAKEITKLYRQHCKNE